MATRKQKHWVGRGPVISVRVEPELAERLDALAARTRRSLSLIHISEPTRPY